MQGHPVKMVKKRLKHTTPHNLAALPFLVRRVPLCSDLEDRQHARSCATVPDWNTLLPQAEQVPSPSPLTLMSFVSGSSDGVFMSAALPSVQFVVTYVITHPYSKTPGVTKKKLMVWCCSPLEFQGSSIHVFIVHSCQPRHKYVTHAHSIQCLFLHS